MTKGRNATRRMQPGLEGFPEMKILELLVYGQKIGNIRMVADGRMINVKSEGLSYNRRYLGKLGDVETMLRNTCNKCYKEGAYELRELK